MPVPNTNSKILDEADDKKIVKVQKKLNHMQRKKESSFPIRVIRF